MSDIGSQVIAFVSPMIPGFLVGLLLGKIDKKALTKALLIAAGIFLALYLGGRFGLDTSTAVDLLEAGSSWAGDKLTGFKQYMAAILPTAAAVGVGFKVGFGRRPKEGAPLSDKLRG
jgi:uncharacterized membrane protein (Fun14 family)